MTDEKRYTERDLVMAKREGYTRNCSNSHCALCATRAKELFPLPKITRPRRLKDSTGTRWRFNEGRLECFDNSIWTEGPFYTMATPERIRIWYDLLENPTEEVEDDGETEKTL
jgi:hypothetical protein